MEEPRSATPYLQTRTATCGKPHGTELCPQQEAKIVFLWCVIATSRQHTNRHRAGSAKADMQEDGFRNRGGLIPEGIHVACLMLASQALIIVTPVLADMLHVGLLKLLDSLFDSCHATVLTHGLCGVVGVCTSTIPIPLDRLGSKSAGNAVFLTQAVQQVSCKHDLQSTIQIEAHSYYEMMSKLAINAIDQAHN